MTLLNILIEMIGKYLKKKKTHKTDKFDIRFL
jgi:hypothetical protein